MMPPGVGFLLAGSAEPHSCKPEPPAEGMRFVVKNPGFPQFSLGVFQLFLLVAAKPQHQTSAAGSLRDGRWAGGVAEFWGC